ncbi:MAG: Hsp70 family protein [Chloroflexota bacterium]
MSTRSTIDFGIDLGTTNSAIACSDKGEVTVIRNNHNQETTPSAVRVDPRGAVVVGKLAHQQVELDPDNTAAEFKRLMGSQQSRTFKRSGQVWSPEQLSAEILKSLRQDVATWSGEDVRAAAITVPALFELPQCEATQRAAKLAGIEYAPLLQEPVAAALAYGMQSEAKRSLWLIYDLGGGTFDTSIVENRDGQLRVLEHSGDNYLGGKDLDWAVVDFLVVCLKKEYALSGLSRQNPNYRGFYTRLKALAEEARIQLSRLDRWSVEISNVGADEAGSVVECFVDVTRQEFEAIARPYITKTVHVARAALVSARLEPSAIERVLLVGGPTQTPLVRAMLQQELKIPLETRLDPMTIVAKGAAIFASMQQMPTGQVRIAANSSAMPIRLVHDATASETSAYVGIGIEPDGQSGPLTVEITRTDGGWSSGRVPIIDQRAEVSVGLRPRAANEFAVRVHDRDGTAVPVAPASFTITHGLNEVSAILSRALGVVVVDGDDAETAIILPKGTPLPTSGKGIFRTRHAVRSKSSDSLKIHVVEGESRRGIRNRHVGTIEVRGADLPRDLPANADIEILLRIDSSRAFQAEMFIPYLDTSLREVIEQKYAPLPVLEDLLRRLGNERRRAHELAADGAQLPELFSEAERDVEAAAGGDADARERAHRRLLDLEIALDRVEEADELPRREREFRGLLTEVEEVVTKYGDSPDLRRLRAVADEAQEAVRRADPLALRNRIRALFTLRLQILDRQPGFWEGLLGMLAPHAEFSVDRARALATVQTGQAAARLGDTERVREAVGELYELLPEGRAEAAHRRLQDAGLRRR